MIIDAHTHIFPDTIRNSRRDYCNDPSFNILYSSEKAKLAGIEDITNYINSSNLDFLWGMAFNWQQQETAALHNEFLASIDDPRIITFGAVPHQCDTIDTWVRHMKSTGLFGIGEVGFYHTGFGQNEEKFLARLLEAAQKYSMPVCLHMNEQVGHSYPGKYTIDLQRTIHVLSAFPEVPVILAHWGGGLLFYETMPEIKKALSHCYYDTAASPYLYDKNIYDLGVRIAGAKRILFGSDFPLLNLERYRKDLDYNTEISAALFGGNAYDIQKKLHHG